MLRFESLHLLEAQVLDGRGILHFALVRMLKHPNLVSSHYEGSVVLLAVPNGQLRIAIALLSERHRSARFLFFIWF